MRLMKNLCYALAILAGLAIVYTSLGTLNGRLRGGFTAQNTAWAVSVAVFAIAVPLGVLAKIVLVLRRKHQRLLRAHPSGRGWVADEAPARLPGAEAVDGEADADNGGGHHKG